MKSKKSTNLKMLTLFVLGITLSAFLMVWYLVAPGDSSLNERIEALFIILLIVLVISFLGTVVTGILTTYHVFKEASKYVTVSVRIPTELYQKLVRYKKVTSPEEMVLEAINYYIENH